MILPPPSRRVTRSSQIKSHLSLSNSRRLQRKQKTPVTPVIEQQQPQQQQIEATMEQQSLGSIIHDIQDHLSTNKNVSSISISNIRDHSSPIAATTAGQETSELPWGSFHCMKKKFGKKCDFCEHMKEKALVRSIYYNRNMKIHGHLAHDLAPMGKIRWFVYSILDEPCNKQIVGSTQDPKLRWANYKSSCNKQNSKSTGLCKHFLEGCPNDQGPEKSTLDFTLIDFLDTTEEQLKKANHVPGPKCRCTECQKLKDLETSGCLRWGLFMGSPDSTTGMRLRGKPGPIGILVNWTVNSFLGGVDHLSTPCCNYSSVL